MENTKTISNIQDKDNLDYLKQLLSAGNDKLKINGRKFDIFNFGDFKEKLYCN